MPCAWCRRGRPAPSPTSTRPTSGSGSATARRAAGHGRQPLTATPARGRGASPRWPRARRPTATGSWRCARSTCPGTRRPVRSVVALSTRAERAGRDHAARGARLLRFPPCPSGRRPPRRRRLGPPRHAVGRLGRARAAPRTGCPGDAARPPSRRTGAAWLVAGGPEESVGQPAWARDGSLRFVSDRRGWWQPYAHPGRPGTAEATALDGGAGRVPRARLGARADDHGRAGRRHGRGPHDGVRAATRLVLVGAAGRATAAPAQLPTALRLDQRALRPRRRSGPDRQHAGRPRERVGLGPRRGATRPLRPPPDVALGRGDVAAGRAVHPDGPLGAARARHALPTGAARDDRSGRTRAPARDVVPRRTDVVVPAGVRSHPAVLHDPRLRRGLRRLRGEHRVRARATAARCGASGASPTPRTASTRRVHLAARGDVDAERMADPGRQRRRHDGPQRTGGGGGVRCLRLVVRRDGPDGAGRHDARLRGPLHRPADRPAARGRARSTTSVRRCTGPPP